jgi:hypothetical protein
MSMVSARGAAQRIEHTDALSRVPGGTLVECGPPHYLTPLVAHTLRPNSSVNVRASADIATFVRVKALRHTRRRALIAKAGMLRPNS